MLDLERPVERLEVGREEMFSRRRRNKGGLIAARSRGPCDLRPRIWRQYREDPSNNCQLNGCDVLREQTNVSPAAVLHCIFLHRWVNERVFYCSFCVRSKERDCSGHGSFISDESSTSQRIWKKGV